MYNGLSLIGGNFPRSPKRINDLPPNGTEFFFPGNASHRRESICMNNLRPMKLISSIKMCVTSHISSWNTESDSPFIDLNYLIGILRAE